MARTVYYQWEAQEYTFEEKGTDWYWALGVIAVAGVIACVLFGNFILALVVLAASGTLALQALRAPTTHTFTITDVGVGVDQTMYSYEEMLHFSVLEYVDPTWPPSLSIKTKRLLAPHIVIPIVDHDPMEIYDFFSAHVEEGKHDESPIDWIVERFRL